METRKIRKKVTLWMGIVLMCLSFGACAGKKDEANDAQKTPEPAADSSTPKPTEATTTSEAFTYELTAKNWNTEGITVKYPLVVNSNDQTKADTINDLIMDDMDRVIEEIKAGADDETGVTIDTLYDYNEYNSALSIEYTGSYFVESAAYPVNFYHTITISLETAAVIPLSDLFVIDEAFVETFLLGIYAPWSEDLDLEASEVNVVDLIKEQYTNQELIDWFSKADANYYLTSQGMMLTVEVPHAVGDYIKMAINYEYLESNMKKDHPVWANYMFINNSESDGAIDPTWLQYTNARYAFALSYPDIFDSAVESDNGDGVTMQSDDGKYSLTIWAANNIDESTGTSLLEKAKALYPEITNDYADEDSYGVIFQASDEGDTRQFVEVGYVNKEHEVFFQLSYPVEEEVAFQKIAEKMESELSID